jgi:hypothetical protein
LVISRWPSLIEFIYPQKTSKLHLFNLAALSNSSPPSAFNMTLTYGSTKFPQPPYPIHESVKDKIHPEYVAFYNKYIINNQQVHYQPVEASRSSGTLIPGGGPPLTVGKTEDIAIKRTETEGPDMMIRCFTPLGEKPADGWPAMVYYHGGKSGIIPFLAKL